MGNPVTDAPWESRFSVYANQFGHKVGTPIKLQPIVKVGLIHLSAEPD